MIVRALSLTGDWTLGRGLSDYLSGSLAVQQNIKTRLQSFLNDCFFDAGAGIDWLNLLGSKQQAALQIAINTVLVNTDYVTAVTQLSVSVGSSRNISITYAVIDAFSGLPAPSGGYVPPGRVAAIVPTSVSYLLTESGLTLETEGGEEISV